MWVNGILLLFNLLPAFPMDGGRVLRALLASRLGLLRATRIAAAIGQGLAILLGWPGCLPRRAILMLVLIALFVFLGAAPGGRRGGDPDGGRRHPGSSR